ncbi:unnamed protein product [Musa banksii]
MLVVMHAASVLNPSAKLILQRQELLEAVERESSIRLDRATTTTIFHHPVHGDFNLQHILSFSPIHGNCQLLEVMKNLKSILSSTLLLLLPWDEHATLLEEVGLDQDLMITCSIWFSPQIQLHRLWA